MSQKVKIALLALLVVGLIGGTVGMMLFNKPHQDLSATAADYQVSATDLFGEFEMNEAGANAKYLNKIVEVKGTIQDSKPTDDGGLILVLSNPGDLFGVNCSFQPESMQAAAALEKGREVKVKGICTGYLMDVNLARCIVSGQ